MESSRFVTSKHAWDVIAWLKLNLHTLSLIAVPRNIKRFVVEHLSRTRAYLPLREIYQIAFNRAWARQRICRRDFYRQFVSPGSLVFDVGANVGEYAYTFLGLGARVVACEPNPDCCARLRALGHKSNLTIRCEALGDRQGESSLFIGNHSGHSTVSEEWMDRASQNDPGYLWNSVIKAPMNTLDRIRQEHGNPDFIKIDVEGYEVCVLRGMSFRPSALSFEFHAYAPDHVKECLLLPVFNSECSFNVTLGDKWEFVWPDWRGKDAILDYASALTGNEFGDVYARFARQ